MFTRVTRNAEFTGLISVDDVKNQLNIIDFDDDDMYLLSLIPVGVELAEKATNRLLIPSTILVSYDAKDLPTYLPYAPWSDTLNSVTVEDLAVDYTFNRISGRVHLTHGVTGTVMMEYSGGYADANSIPTPIKHGALMLIADLYTHRHDTTTEPNNKVVLTARTLLSGYIWGGC